MTAPRSVTGRTPWIWVEVPASARTLRQKVAYLARRGYVWGAFLLSKHANKVLVGLLQRTHPDVPWKNVHFASEYLHLASGRRR